MDPPGVVAGEASTVKEDESQLEDSKIAEVVANGSMTLNQTAEAFKDRVNLLRGVKQTGVEKSDIEAMRTRFVAVVPKDHGPGDIFHVKTSDPISGNTCPFSMRPYHLSCTHVGPFQV